MATWPEETWSERNLTALLQTWSCTVIIITLRIYEVCQQVSCLTMGQVQYCADFSFKASYIALTKGQFGTVSATISNLIECIKTVNPACLLQACTGRRNTITAFKKLSEV